MKESDLKVSKRISNYAKDSGLVRYKKIIARVNSNLMIKNI